jgi:hypothetical protein
VTRSAQPHTISVSSFRSAATCSPNTCELGFGNIRGGTLPTVFEGARRTRPCQAPVAPAERARRKDFEPPPLALSRSIGLALNGTEWGGR